MATDWGALITGRPTPALGRSAAHRCTGNQDTCPVCAPAIDRLEYERAWPRNDDAPRGWEP